MEGHSRSTQGSELFKQTLTLQEQVAKGVHQSPKVSQAELIRHSVNLRYSGNPLIFRKIDKKNYFFCFLSLSHSQILLFYYFPVLDPHFSGPKGRRQAVVADNGTLCPGQDIILYCKFNKETLQYRWCTIQGCIPSPSLAQVSAHSILCGSTPAGEGCQTVTITEFLAMVRVLRPSLYVIGSRRCWTVVCCQPFSSDSAASFK